MENQYQNTGIIQRDTYLSTEIESPMTKESLLDPHLKYAWECDEGAQVILYSEAEKAMDEFSKQQCIEFFKFLLPSGPDFDASLANRYHQFIERQNKEK